MCSWYLYYDGINCWTLSEYNGAGPSRDEERNPDLLNIDVTFYFSYNF